MNKPTKHSSFQTLLWINDSKEQIQDHLARLKNADFFIYEETISQWIHHDYHMSPGIILLQITPEIDDLARTIIEITSKTTLPHNIAPSIIGIFDSNTSQYKELFFASGGSSCLIKPYGQTELLSLVTFHSKTLKDKYDAIAQIHEASQMALLAMENSSELGGILHFIKKAIGAKHYRELAQQLFAAVEAHCDSCLIEIKGHKKNHYFSAHKQANQLIETDVDIDMQHYLHTQKDAGRIIKLDSILQINQSNLSILLDGVFYEDEAKMERISDTLVILSDVANRFAQSISTEENLQKTETERQAFLNTLSHELRTPLNGVIGFSKALKSKSADLPLGQNGIDALIKIIDGTEQINAIISTLMEISSFESGKHNHFEKIDINSLLIRLKTKFQPLAEAKNLAFYSQSPSGIKIFSNPSKVFNILSHLLDNAIKFTDQGNVMIQASLDSKPGIGQHLIIKISDTGIGIDPKDHQRIFTEIGQLNTEHNRRHYGIGLGLYYSHLTSSQLNGKLTVESSPGHGSSFFLTLPLSETILPDSLSDSVLF